MPGLKSKLQHEDLDFLNRIARSWGIEVSQRSTDDALMDLLLGMAEAGRLEMCLANLPAQAQEAWKGLASRGGKLPWVEFTRRYGEVRDFGPARRERENPDRHPASITEVLWYAGLINRAFLSVNNDPIEYAYIPDELMPAIESTDHGVIKANLRPLVNQQPKFVNRSDTSLLDHLTDLLAAYRMKREIPVEVFESWGIDPRFLRGLLGSSGLIDEQDQPQTEMLKTFFSADRAGALQFIYDAWLSSNQINELRLLPGLTFEGTWRNDPITPRRLVVDILRGLDHHSWWSLTSLITLVKDTQPDFQRPAGDYDSWFIREGESGNFLRGFENWNKVEGALLYYLVTGPLYWLGLVNLARGSREGKYIAFHLVPETCGVLEGKIGQDLPPEDREVKLRDARIFVLPDLTPRRLRYQVGRFCELMQAYPSESWYGMTPASLAAAARQDLKPGQLLQLLEKEYGFSIPADLRNLVERWSRKGVEARIERGILLRFQEDAACAELIRAAGDRFNLEVMNGRTVLLSARNLDTVGKLLNSLGILVEVDADV